MTTKTLPEALKGALQKPAWADFVKTSHGRQRQPTNPDWWYERAASLLGKIDRLGPIGVQKLRRKYGGAKNRGYKPERFTLASAHVLRTLLQQLEAAGLIQQVKSSKRKGRVLTKKGTELLKHHRSPTPSASHAASAKKADAPAVEA